MPKKRQANNFAGDPKVRQTIFNGRHFSFMAFFLHVLVVNVEVHTRGFPRHAYASTSSLVSLERRPRFPPSSAPIVTRPLIDAPGLTDQICASMSPSTRALSAISNRSLTRK